jgi:hypothetical protein
MQTQYRIEDGVIYRTDLYDDGKASITVIPKENEVDYAAALAEIQSSIIPS